MRMSDYNDKTVCQEFEDDLTHLIDTADDRLTLCEMVGIMELQLHILKNRFTLPSPKKDGSQQQ